MRGIIEGAVVDSHKRQKVCLLLYVLDSLPFTEYTTHILIAVSPLPFAGLTLPLVCPL